MEYEQIKHELENSATLRLLRSRNAALILSFLHQQFKTNQQVSIPQIELENKLGDYLEFLQEVSPEDSYPRSPKEYLGEWCDDRLLTKTFDNSDDPVFALTPAAEKAIATLEDLQKRDEFVGTESRFLQIFALLKEIQDCSTTDIETRIAQLEQDRDRLQQEIDRIRQTGAVERYNQTQLQERFLLADRLTRQLIADFREIEQNFRNLTRKVQAAQLEKDSRKGMVLGRVLDADQELKESDQGKSFYAFWNFLMSESKRQELKSMIQAVYHLEELRSLTQEYNLLRRIERSLLDAGEYIVQSNHRLTEKLRQMLDERNLQENRRVADLIVEVQRLALEAARDPAVERDFWTLEGEPSVHLVLERPLHPLEESEVPTFALDFVDLSDVSLDEEIAELYQQFYVDEDLLARRIARILEQCSIVSLTDLIQLYPVTQGLPEIVAYLTIATKYSRHSIDTSTIDSITISGLKPETQLQLKLPKITFRR
ncbi:MAG: DUF3375 domain-containing protein [Cyanosarcina radialis HA8281-LM2]|jgi:hypothetical protein|nr:DUF3375 domain-containing protein [Cyanosarcina radialis HA8281-LM2]